MRLWRERVFHGGLRYNFFDLFLFLNIFTINLSIMAEWTVPLDIIYTVDSRASLYKLY